MRNNLHSNRFRMALKLFGIFGGLMGEPHGLGFLCLCFICAICGQSRNQPPLATGSALPYAIMVFMTMLSNITMFYNNQ
jgi:hypothetical protein